MGKIAFVKKNQNELIAFNKETLDFYVVEPIVKKYMKVFYQMVMRNLKVNLTLVKRILIVSTKNCL